MPPIVHLERDEGFALITLDDGKTNIFSPAMRTALNSTLDKVTHDTSVKALIITGRDNYFSSRMEPAKTTDGLTTQPMIEADAQLTLRLYTYPKPVVIACTGTALAMGGILLLTADWRSGANGSFLISMHDAQPGGMPPHFATALARERLSPRYLSRAVVNAEAFPPSLAVEAGYLDEVVDAASVLDFACLQAERLAKLNPQVFAATKRQLRAATLARINSGSTA